MKLNKKIIDIQYSKHFSLHLTLKSDSQKHLKQLRNNHMFADVL